MLSVVVVTKQAGSQLAQCLGSLSLYDEVFVVDSGDDECVRELCRHYQNVQFVSFCWDGQYPKKRQWCLDNLSLKNDWVLFVDADEVVPDLLFQEIMRVLSKDVSKMAGYFIKGLYRIDGQLLRFGLPNRKLALIHKDRMCFPVIDDLHIEGMGEIEGHYQPVLSDAAEGLTVGSLRHYLIHDAVVDWHEWRAKHSRYAQWARAVNFQNKLPEDPRVIVGLMKRWFRFIPFKACAYFFYAYVIRCGFLDGRKGFILAKERSLYYKTVYC